MNILDTVGCTPVIELKKITSGIDGVSVFVKAEYFNPSGSVKDRAAKAMMLDGIATGRLTKEKTILDSTSGNTGIAYAMFGASLGYKVKLFMPSNASTERKKLIRAYGAEIVETDPLEGSDGAYRAVMELAEREPDTYFFPNQYDNAANSRAHYETTGVELYEQCKPTHFVAGTGTSGTFMGVSRRLKEYDPTISIVLMQPDSPFHGLEGMKHMGATIKPKIFDESIADARIEVKTEDAYKTARRLAAEEGLFVGVSSGANVHAALELAKTLQFISTLPIIKGRLETDVEAVFNGDPAAYSKAEIIISYPGVYAAMVYRAAHELYLLSVPLIPRIMSEHAHSVTGIDIHPGAAIGKYFFMDHGTGIVIGETTIIGDHVKLYQGVTLGALSTKGGQKLKNVKRHPTISDNVTIYSGASILGGETIVGEGVVVGGNAFVVSSVPENTRVSVKNPELQFKSSLSASARSELDQMEFWHYEI